MKINNREFREWTADDLQVLLNNDAYRAHWGQTPRNTNKKTKVELKIL